LKPKPRAVNVDRLLIDWADELIQDLVASFSARRPSMPLRLAVAGFYIFAALHLAFAVILPFYRGSMASVIEGGGSITPPAQLEALATGIIIGGISYHLLLTVAYLFMSFVVRASKRWTRLAGTAVLAVNFVVALNGLRSPDIADIFPLLQWITLTLAGAIIALLWTAALSESGSFASSPGRTLSGDARE